MSQDLELSTMVAIPAYNEEQSIGKVIKSIQEIYPHINLVVIDDGSTDSTVEVATNEDAHVIKHFDNLGYTAAIQTARKYFLTTQFSYLVFVDADSQHRSRDIMRIIDVLSQKDADQVRGSRELGTYDTKEPFVIKFARWFCSFIVTLATRHLFTDVTSGFKGETRSVSEYFSQVYDSTNKLHQSNTNDIEEHLLAKRSGFKLREVPTVMVAREQGSTKCYGPKQLLFFPFDLIKVIFRNT